MKRKLKKKYNEIKLLPIENDCIRYKKEFIEIHKIKYDEIAKIIENIDGIGYYKFLFNFKENLYYLFKYNNETELAYGELLNKEDILTLYKSFYTDEKLLDGIDFKKMKHKLIKKEIAPYEFEINPSNIKIDKGYYKVDAVERIDANCNYNIEEIFKDEDAWIAVEFRKMDQNLLLNTITEMQDNGYIDKNMHNGFLKRNIENLKTELKEKKIVQCEFKILLLNKSMEDLQVKNEKILLKLRLKGVNTFEIHEKLNLITAFNSTIYPYKDDRLEIIQSMYQENFINLLTYDKGSEINEDCRATC